MKTDAGRGSSRAEPAAGEGNLAGLAMLALVAGAGAGLIVAMFRLALAAADRWRNSLISGAHDWPLLGCVPVALGCAAAVALAAWLVRRFSPYASGSGIPQGRGGADRRPASGLAAADPGQIFWRPVGDRLPRPAASAAMPLARRSFNSEANVGLPKVSHQFAVGAANWSRK